MRVLFSCTPGDGHFYPLVPLADAMLRRGHDVVFAMAAEYEQRITSGGFSWFPSGITSHELDARYMRRMPDLPPPESPVYMPSAVAARFAAGDAADRLADLQDLTARWRPDLIVFEPCDLAGPIAAAALGVPAVHHAFGRVLPPACYERSAHYVEPLWHQVGLEMPPLCGMYDGQYVDICPPSLQGAGVPEWARVLPMQATSPPQPSLLPWLQQLPERPSVYVTLGTLFNDIDRLRLLLDAFADLDANIIMTIGRNNDPADLEPVPANAVVERFVPQAVLLPHMSVTVTHAGSGSMLGALAHGLPMLMLPAGADQLENARACRELGVARVVAADDLDEDVVRLELAALLTDASYAQRATAMEREIAAMPQADDVAAALTGAG